MKKLFRVFVLMGAIATMLPACDKNNGEPEPDPVPAPAPEPEPEPEPEPKPVVQTVNTWRFNDGAEVKIGSSLVYEKAGQVVVLLSAEEGLSAAPQLELASDCTELTFPVAEIGKDIDLAALRGEGSATRFVSYLSKFGAASGFRIPGDGATLSEGTLSSALDGDEITVKCEFTTLATDTKFSLYLVAPYHRAAPGAKEGSSLEYRIESTGASKSTTFGSGFFLQNSWNGAWTFTYSISSLNTYINIGNSTNVEIYVGAEELLTGEPFDVATTDYPFSFTFNILDTSIGDLVPYTIDNGNRTGASGSITFIRNNTGLYDVEFDVTINNGDIKVAGYYADVLQPRNMINNGGNDNYGIIRSATLDVRSNPVVLYLSTGDGVAGPDDYDIKGVVPAAEWKYGKFMAFGGQESKVTWIDGETYSSATTSTSTVKGGNWRVMSPVEIPGGCASECTVILFGSPNRFAYYYGEIIIIE